MKTQGGSLKLFFYLFGGLFILFHVVFYKEVHGLCNNIVCKRWPVDKGLLDFTISTLHFHNSISVLIFSVSNCPSKAPL